VDHRPATETLTLTEREERRNAVTSLPDRFRASLSIRYQSLFVALLLFLGVPFVLPEEMPGLLLPLLFMLVALAALSSASRRPSTLLIGLILAVPAILAAWLEPTDPMWAILGGIAQILFLGWITAGLLDHVIRARRVTSDILFGLASVYLLLASIWAVGYGIADTIEPGAIAFPSEDTEASADLHTISGERTRSYFSFVTLTTLGYGDMRPVSDMARIMAMLEAALGQLFLVMVVARIVGIHTAQRMREEREAKGSD
jgi:hypothetical protein